MAARIGVLLVHGIGSQQPESLITAWGNPLEREVLAILHEQKRSSDEAAGIEYREYLWDPQIRAFSGLAVTTWTLMNLPRIMAIHAALSHQSRAEDLHHPEEPAQVFPHYLLRFWIFFWRGWVTPALIVPLVCVLWIINPPIVLVTGVASMLRPSVWKDRKFPWNPVRPANFVMARIIGDAYVWLASPVGRLLSRGSRQVLINGLNSKLDEMLDEFTSVVIVAHSQGAAIAVEALRERAAKAKAPARLVTVGGGHRLLQGLHASQQGSASPGLWALYSSLGFIILAQALIFQYFYIGFLLFWFAATPLLLTASFLTQAYPSTITGDASPRWIDLAYAFAGHLWHFGGAIGTAVTLACLLTVTLTQFRFGRPRVPEALEVGCPSTEIWSRFDPVCIGPRLNVAAMPTIRREARKQNRDSLTVETWILQHGWPALEHTSYFLPNSSSLRVAAMSIAWQLNSLKVSYSTPASHSTVTTGRRWIKIFKLIVILVMTLGFAWAVLLANVVLG
jgi:hypothetical protein